MEELSILMDIEFSTVVHHLGKRTKPWWGGGGFEVRRFWSYNLEVRTRHSPGCPRALAPLRFAVVVLIRRPSVALPEVLLRTRHHSPRRDRRAALQTGGPDCRGNTGGEEEKAQATTTEEVSAEGGCCGAAGAPAAQTSLFRRPGAAGRRERVQQSRCKPSHESREPAPVAGGDRQAALGAARREHASEARRAQCERSAARRAQRRPRRSELRLGQL